MHLEQGVVNDGLPVTVSGVLTPDLISTAPITGQAIISSTGVAVQLSSGTLTNGVIITAFSNNTAPIVIGGSGVTNTINGSGNGYILEAGASVSMAVDNPSRIYINGTSGDFISFCGS